MYTSTEGPGSPLSGLTVLELGNSLAAPTAGRILADLGADVVTIELPGQSTVQSERIALDRNKRSVLLDEAPGAARGQALHGLAASVDVVIDGLEDPNLIDMSSASCPPRNQVYCRVSAFGGSDDQSSPIDLVVQALSGCIDLTGHPGGPPCEMGIPLADLAAGIYTAIGVLGALLGRRHGRPSSHVEVAKIDSAVALLSYMAVSYFADGHFPSRVGTGHAGIVPYNAFRAADGEIVVAPFTQRFWRNFCQAIGRPDLIDTEEFTNFAGRVENKDALMRELDPLLLGKKVREWLAVFAEYDVPCGPVLSVDAALELDQTTHRDMIRPLPIEGTVLRTVGPPFRFHDESGLLDLPERPPQPSEQTTLRGSAAHTAPEDAAESTRNAAFSADQHLPLDGVRVLDLTRMFAGPCGTQVLADLGADVIKVEEPRIGDPTRRNIPFWGDESAYFMSINRGKRSVRLDLKSEAGKESAMRLAETADVVVENYRPGVMARLGLDYTSLREHNPSLIMASLSGFGASGPLRDKISFDLVNQAMSGLIDLTGEPSRRPARIGVPVGDMAGGLYMAIGVLAALHRRDRTGRGCWLDLSLHDVLLDLLGPLGQEALSECDSPTRTGSRDRKTAPRGTFEAADGWLVFSATTEDTFLRLVDVLDLDHLKDDPRFTSPQQRKAHEAALESILAAALSTRTVTDWMDMLRAAGVPAAPVRSLKEAVESPLVVDRNLIYAARHEGIGTVRNLASPVVLNGARLGTGTVSPLLGHDTAAVLSKLRIATDQQATETSA